MEEIPIEGFQVAEIEDQAVALWDRALVKKLGLDDAKEFVGVAARGMEPGSEVGQGGETARKGDSCVHEYPKWCGT